MGNSKPETETAAKTEDKDLEIAELKKQLTEMKAKSDADIEAIKAENAAKIEAIREEHMKELAEAAKIPGVPAEPVHGYDPGEEYVDYVIPRTGPEDSPVFIGVNGDSVRVVPGVRVQLKRKFVEVYEHAQKQEREAWEAQRKLLEASNKALADL